MMMKLSKLAKMLGVHYRTVWNWYRSGKISGAVKTPTGKILVPDDTIEKLFNQDNSRVKRAALYARVSSHDSRDNLERQLERLRDFASANGFTITVEVKEVASGVNDKRRKLMKLLTEDVDKFDVLIVEHKDRLTRFGFNYILNWLHAIGKEIIVVNEGSDERSDLIHDFIAIIYSFAARLYGIRRAHKKAEQIKKLVTEDDS